MTLVASKEWQTAAPLVWVYGPVWGERWTEETKLGRDSTVLGWQTDGHLSNKN